MIIARGDEVVELGEGVVTNTRCSNVLVWASEFLVWQEQLQFFPSRKKCASFTFDTYEQ